MKVRPHHREDLPNAPVEKHMQRAHCWGEVDSALCMLGSAGLMDCQLPSSLDIMDHLSLQEGHGQLPLEVALMTLVNSAPACPNVLQLLEWSDHRRRFTMILERPVPCQDLQSFCEENGHLDESLAKKVLLQLISALRHCESHGVLHRDVKSENLLISTESHDIKLLDFGCGDLLKDSAYKYFAGTLEYAPPEWFRQRRYHAGPATVWSVGVTLFNILCGCFPFRGARRVTSKSRLHFPREMSTGKRQKSRTDPECRQLIRWCLSASASDRPSLDDIESHPWLQ
ncbi:serine threonine- kinase pim-3-like protein [Labeo rohita]|uniref:Serine/threonine-protein kinase n=2 Tax=Labeo rohita TaxID=84645 RepID=A0A498LAA1_LABRO|nr:serine threonine- kinase pim-3-like protein [Labeo rohita]